MNTALEQIGFSVEITKDGSPTLRLPGSGESMHHSAGAATETNYIYTQIIDKVHLQLTPHCKTCIVGLGLGYIEIAWALSLLKYNLQPNNDLCFTSFEILPELQKSFLDWLESDKESLQDLILQKMNPEADANANAKEQTNDVKKILKQALISGSTLENDLIHFQRSDSNFKWNLICYDAFSQKTSGPLWEAEFLNSFIEKRCAPDCALTTYACTGVLRKTLQQNNFTFIKRPGFSGKRDSSLAYRGKILL